MSHRCMSYDEEAEMVLGYLEEHGCELIEVRNCVGRHPIVGEDLGVVVERLAECEEAHLIVRDHTGRRRWMFFVYGNEVGVLVNDYSVNPNIEDDSEDPLRGGPEAYGTGTVKCEECGGEE